MVGEITLADLRITAAAATDRQRGLLFFVSFRLGPLVIDGATVRRTRDGRIVMGFPVRHDGGGRQHPIVRPANDDARRTIEAQVFSALGIKAEQVAS